MRFHQIVLYVSLCMLALGDSLLRAQTNGDDPNYKIETFNYPGTNFKTELRSINDHGIAVGTFTVLGPRPLRPSETCDPAVFGGPCPPPGSYPFVYADGKFTRIKVKDYSAPAISINNNGQVLLGDMVGLVLLYDYAHAVARYGGTVGKAPTLGPTYKLILTNPSGLNDNGDAVAVAMPMDGGKMLKNSAVFGKYAFVPVPKAGIGDDDPPEGSFKTFTPALPGCSDYDKNPKLLDVTNPNDQGKVAVGCSSIVTIYDSKTDTSTAPLPMPSGVDMIHVRGLSNNGLIAGCYGTGIPKQTGFVYKGGHIDSLVLKERIGCALGINNNGVVVGFDGDKAFIARPLHTQ